MGLGAHRRWALADSARVSASCLTPAEI